MNPPREKQAIKRIGEILSEYLGDERTRFEIMDGPQDMGVDAICGSGGRYFAIQYKWSGAAGPVRAGIDQLKWSRAGITGGKMSKKKVVPILAVPFMGPTGRELCERAGLSWLDLCGNARISDEELRIMVDGQPNRFRGRGRPASVFAPVASRIARWFLLHPGGKASQRELARGTQMDEGYVTRIARRLEDEGYVARGSDGALRCTDPRVLLDAWRESYEFSSLRTIEGHVPARSGDALLKEVGSALERAKVQYAATGLAGAWLLTHFAGFRRVSILVKEFPAAEALAGLSFREDPAGSNLRLAIPADESAFWETSEVEGVKCAHALQVYLDLKNETERAREASEKIRAIMLTDYALS